MQISKTMKTLLFVLMALVMVSSLAFDGPPGGGWGNWGQVAEEMYRSALKLEVSLQKSINKANTDDVPYVQNYITKLKDQGKDAAPVEAALAVFITKIADTQVLHDQGKAILDLHEGFDDEGNVIDVEKALDTAMNAQEKLMEGNGLLTEARFEMFKLVDEWVVIMKSLPRQYRAEQRMLKVLDRRLANTAKTVTKTQTYIDKQAAKGKDVTELVAALDAYKAKVAEAQADRDNAAAILEAHAGFDENGNVIDATLAQQTVDDADAALDSANAKLTQAAKDLSRAMLLWRKTHR